MTRCFVGDHRQGSDERQGRKKKKESASFFCFSSPDAPLHEKKYARKSFFDGFFFVQRRSSLLPVFLKEPVKRAGRKRARHPEPTKAWTDSELGGRGWGGGPMWCPFCGSGGGAHAKPDADRLRSVPCPGSARPLFFVLFPLFFSPIILVHCSCDFAGADHLLRRHADQSRNRPAPFFLWPRKKIGRLM